MHLFRLKKLCAAAAIALALTACSSQRGALTYFNDIESIAPIEIGDYQVKVEPSDELFISINSTNPSATALYNAPLINPALNSDLMTLTQARTQTYIVDSNGNIDLPMIGRLHVAGLTLEQIKDIITKKISADVEDPLVKVELVNFQIDVAGEVTSPGRYPITGTRVSVLDALSLAGDLTPYGLRDNVLIVREENGKRTSARLNLNNAESLSSPYFFLKQNDYIYVEPSPVRKDNADYNQNNSYKLSVISTIVSGCSVIASLVIALAIK